MTHKALVLLAARFALAVSNSITTAADTTNTVQQVVAKPFAEGPPVLSQAFFGINLGESLKSLGEKCRKAVVSADGNKWNFGDKDFPGRIISLNGALNGNKAVKETQVSIYSNRVFAIELVFADTSEQNYNVLKSSLEKKYGKDKGGLFDAVEDKSRFTTTVDDQSVRIVLNRDITFDALEAVEIGAFNATPLAEPRCEHAPQVLGLH